MCASSKCFEIDTKLLVDQENIVLTSQGTTHLHNQKRSIMFPMKTNLLWGR
uniref:Uncharacterized protein n=1 Tax=Arundo donax TaxID=35708 RepID=A0A0A9AN56_ARUDO